MKKLVIITGVFLLAAGLFSIKYFTILLDSKESAIVINKPYPFKENYKNTENMVNAVDHIFIGEVVTETGREPYNGRHNTQFKVMITQNIKGALMGDITVNQEGGYYKKHGKLYLETYENTLILKEKQMYLLAVTRTDKGFFQVVPVYGATPLKNEEEKYEQIAIIKQAMAKE
ncbi:hypothetical protein [Bacillus sp. FJAT-29814]|uniref:hypothetical protein n=1 Tax=Bacillus sp. FJAT-29814 TaxID=1729688 RepID=UPI000834E8DD|nr:hypothetical protein [Bacillus sp. FJAT-29814]